MKDSVYLDGSVPSTQSVYLEDEDDLHVFMMGVRKRRKESAPQTPHNTGAASDTGQSGDRNMFQISKSLEEKQLVFGWANIAVDTEGNYPIDWDGDVTPPEELEKAAYTFVLKYRATGENHQGEVKGHLVESVMLTKEKQEAMGIPDGTVPQGWWVGFYVPDKEVFAKIKSGEYEMFSVQGKANRTPTGQ